MGDDILKLSSTKEKLFLFIQQKLFNVITSGQRKTDKIN